LLLNERRDRVIEPANLEAAARIVDFGRLAADSEGTLLAAIAPVFRQAFERVEADEARVWVLVVREPPFQ
jgi:hypothetical protein